MPYNKLTLVYLLFSSALFMAVYVNFFSPPDGYTGAPDELACRACHSSPADPVQMTVSVEDLPSELIGGQTYALRVALSADYGVFGGFEAVSLNDDLVNAGTWSNAGSGVIFSASNNRRYAKHAEGAVMSGVGTGNHFHSFNMSWQPGEVSTPEAVTIWVSGVSGGETEGPAEDAFSTGSRTVMVYPVLTADLLQQTRVSCFGEADGSITAEGIGGKPPYDFSWSNGANGASVNNLAAGSYTVTVTDELNQSTQMTFTLGQPTELIADVSQVVPIECHNSLTGALAVDHNGGTPPYFYEWSNGQTGEEIFNLAAGTYSVSVYDDNNCLSVAEYLLEAPEIMSWELLQLVPEDCDGMANGAISILTNGGVPAYEYFWSNGATGPILEGLTAGEYGLTIVDSRGCELVTDFIIPSLSNINVNTVSLENVSCQGESDGQITVSATGGESPFSFAWSNGQLGSQLQNVPAGNYALTVTDNLNCSFISSFELTEPPQLAIQNIQIIDATAETGGRINLNLSGGTPPYTFSWTGPNGFTSASTSLNDLEAGIYAVTITDANGCELTNGDQQIVVSQTTDLITIEASASIRLFPNPATNLCYLETDSNKKGTIKVYSLNGKLMWERQFDHRIRYNISTADWASGVYLVRYQTDKELFQKQLVVVR